MLDIEVEHLENRQMMAGNVTANVTAAGNLVVNGDADGNAISVVMSSDGRAGVAGLDGETVDSGNLSTAVVTGDIRINLKGGNDSVNFNGLANVENKIRVDGGSGNDMITVHYSFDDVQINGGSGHDTIEVKYSYGGSVTLNGGGGNDDIILGDSTLYGAQKIAGGSGNDTLGVIATTVIGDSKLLMGGGDDGVEFSGFDSSGNVLLNTAGG